MEHEFYDFPYGGNSNPNWRSHIFQRGRLNHQPVKIVISMLDPLNLHAARWFPHLETSIEGIQQGMFSKSSGYCPRIIPLNPKNYPMTTPWIPISQVFIGYFFCWPTCQAVLAGRKMDLDRAQAAGWWMKHHRNFMRFMGGKKWNKREYIWLKREYIYIYIPAIFQLMTDNLIFDYLWNGSIPSTVAIFMGRMMTMKHWILRHFFLW